MKQIPLTQNKFALVDDKDYEYLSKFTWQCNKGYARRSWRENGIVKNQLMHREILKAPVGRQVDHVNGNRLDNRRSNLRLCTAQGNNRNVNSRIGISGYKGVQWYSKIKKWSAVITVNYKHKYLGSFDDPKDAAKAYNKAAIEHFGEFAKINNL